MSIFSTHQPARWFPVLTGAFVGILIISEVAAVKIVQLGSLTVPGAVILFPLSYILGDIFTEVYGYAKARQAIWTGFIMAVVMVIAFEIVGRLPSAPFWTNQAAWDTTLGMTPRIVLASLVAFVVGAFSNSYVLARMKVRSKGKHLWKRTIGSTIVGEGLDTLLFITIAFGATMTESQLLSVILSQYLIKVGVEIILTPVTYKVVAYLKKAEKQDVYDVKTDFNPLHLA